MAVREAPLLGGAFWGGAMASEAGIRQRVKASEVTICTPADVMVDSSAPWR